jgi:diacylglycerol O-acyltransferase / wax synthase
MTMIKMMPLDMSWFLLESKVVPVHGAFLYVFTPPAGAKPGYAKSLLKTMKKRAVGAPFNLRPQLKMGALPFWEEVDVDLDQHVSESTLPAPGDEHQLLATAAELAGPPLSWKQPLWRIHWIDGLAGGRFAFLFVAHHSQWDGISVFRLMSETMSESAQDRTIRAPWQGVSTWLKHVSKSNAPRDRRERPSNLGNARKILGEVTSAAADLGRVFSQQGLQAIAGGRHIALPLAAPESRPERNGSSARTYGLAKIPVARVKALAKATESTFNDVMTTAVDAAYSRYLEELGMAAKKPMVAVVPMAIKVPGAGNQISGGMVPLAKPGGTPLERLADVRKSMGNVKDEIGAMSASGAKLYAMINMGIAATPDLLRVGERLPVSANMMISNPYGIPKPLHLNRSRLDYFVPLMGPSLGTRLMFGIYTYAEETYVSITSLKSVVSDVEHLSELVQKAFDELERAASGSTEPAEQKRQPAKSRARKARHASAPARRRSTPRTAAR